MKNFLNIITIVLLVALTILTMPIAASAVNYSRVDLLSPANSTVFISEGQPVNLAWQPYAADKPGTFWSGVSYVEIATAYINDIQYFKDSDLIDAQSYSFYVTNYQTVNLLPGVYYWHVNAEFYVWESGSQSQRYIWSPIRSFTIQRQPPAPPTPIITPPAPVKMAAQSVIEFFSYAKKIKKGKTTSVRGFLTSNKKGVKATIKIQQLFKTWKTIKVVNTDAVNGYYAVKVKPSKTTYYRAVFSGNTDYLASSSKKLKISVVQHKDKKNKKR